MKRLLFIYVLSIFACTHFKSKQERAQDLVNNYLDSILISPNNYESRLFTNVTPVFSTYAASEPDGINLRKLEFKYADSDIYYQSDKKNKKKFKYFMLKKDSIQNILELKQANYKGRLLRYEITHVYKSKNASGDWKLKATTFAIDTEVTKIIRVY